MDNEKTYFKPKKNGATVPKKKNNIKLSKKDTVFVPVFFAAVFVFIDFAVMHGFNLGFTLSYFILFAVFTAYLFKPQIRITPFVFLCGALSLAGAVTFSLYKDSFISFVMFFLVFALFGIYLLGLSGGVKRNGGSYKMLYEALGSVFFIPFSCAPQIAEEFRKTIAKNKISKNAIIGIALSLPVLLVIIPLLVSSDEAFEGLVKIVLNNVGIYLLEIALSLAVLPFILFYAVSRKNDDRVVGRSYSKMGTGVFQPAIAVSFLSVISFTYTVYLFSQLAYFFSAFSGILPEGYEYTASAFARRGFFEMFAICVINMLIIALSNILSKRNAKGKIHTGIKAFSVFILCFTVLILVTAMSKMKLNIEIFGLSKNRLLVSVFMLMIFVVIVFYIIHIFFPRVNYIQPIIVICSTIFIALSFSNVNDLVIRYNIDMYNKGNLERIDLEYISELSEMPCMYFAQLMQSDNKETANNAAALIAREIEENYPQIKQETDIGNYKSEIDYETSADFRSFNYFRDKAAGQSLAEYYNSLSEAERKKLFNRLDFYNGSYNYDAERDMYISYNDVYCFEYKYNKENDLYEYARQYEYNTDENGKVQKEESDSDGYGYNEFAENNYAVS